jgi:hypothetical protein
MTGKIRLIIEEPAAAMEDRFGGERHGVISRALGRSALDVPVDRFTSELEAVVSAVQSVTSRLKAGVGEFFVEEVTIALGVSAEGSIGVATAGVEASINVSLKRRREGAT